MSTFLDVYKAQIGPHYQGVAPAWPAPEGEPQGGMEGTVSDGIDYLPLPARKSFIDLCNENPTIMQAYNGSEIIKSMLDGIAETFIDVEAHLAGIMSEHAGELDAFNKSFADALCSMADFVEKGNMKLQDISEAQTAPEAVQKSLPSNWVPNPHDEGMEAADPFDVRDNIVKAEIEGRISTQDVTFYEMNGHPNAKTQRVLEGMR